MQEEKKPVWTVLRGQTRNVFGFLEEVLGNISSVVRSVVHATVAVWRLLASLTVVCACIAVLFWSDPAREMKAPLNLDALLTLKCTKEQSFSPTILATRRSNGIFRLLISIEPLEYYADIDLGNSLHLGELSVLFNEGEIAPIKGIELPAFGAGVCKGAQFKFGQSAYQRQLYDFDFEVVGAKVLYFTKPNNDENCVTLSLNTAGDPSGLDTSSGICGLSLRGDWAFDLNALNHESPTTWDSALNLQSEYHARAFVIDIDCHECAVDNSGQSGFMLGISYRYDFSAGKQSSASDWISVRRGITVSSNRYEAQPSSSQSEFDPFARSWLTSQKTEDRMSFVWHDKKAERVKRMLDLLLATVLGISLTLAVENFVRLYRKK